MTDDSWHVVKNTPGVTGFVGGVGTAPSASGRPRCRELEVNRLLHTATAGDAAKPKSRAEFSLGEMVKVTSGPLSDFDGEIIEVNPEAGRLKVSVSIFERQVPVELDVRGRQEDRLASPRSSTTWESPRARAPRTTRRTDGQEGHEAHQAPDPRRAGQPGAAGRPRARPARRQHHGVLQGVQRRDRRSASRAASRRSRSRSSRTARSPSSRRRRPPPC